MENSNERRGADQFRDIARMYEEHADIYPEGHLGRTGNLAEAAKYLALAARAETWPAEVSR